eukprot:TRINITY_DN24814_c0_g1_i1.p1 TRINITY_DN24814_c0_g1~~TRINITY_DN24814_c0_g1_i1.p1  ORF type:complete len:430 (+),score=45.87 TRINITY_DN24814_c0_g1_i1:70-1359(+)
MSRQSSFGSAVSPFDSRLSSLDNLEQVVLKVRRLDRVVRYLHGHTRGMSVAYLGIGSMCGFFGFMIAGYLGLQRFSGGDEKNAFGEDFPSGHQYHPLTVSDMVADPSSPEGKCFFAFCLAGSMCLLISGYPWKLKSVYVGDDIRLCFRDVTYVNLRTFWPPVGMLLVCCCTVTRGPRDDSEKLAVWVHTIGAVMMLGGYMVFECHSLWRLWSHPSALQRKEKHIRAALMLLCIVTACLFEVCSVVAASTITRCLLSQERSIGGCRCDSEQARAAFMTEGWKTTCIDEYLEPTQANITDAEEQHHLLVAVRLELAIARKKAVLYNTASGWFLFLKQINFWCEVIAGLSMLASQGAIYWFCLERAVNLDDTLPPLERHLLESEGLADFSFELASIPEHRPTSERGHGVKVERSLGTMTNQPRDLRLIPASF